jgi:hypothetical protein
MQHLFADYLSFVRGGPNNGLRPARGLTVPFVWAGGKYYLRPGQEVDIYTSHHVAKTIPYWESYVGFDPMLREWLKSPQSFRPPKRWPPDWPLPDHVSPRNVAQDFLPTPTKNGFPKFGSPLYKNWTLQIQGLHELSAYAHGWPLTPHEVQTARDACHALMESPSFIVYALAVADHLPMRFGKESIFLRMDRKERLQTDPLSLSPEAIRRTLPEWCNTPAALIRHCPARETVVGSSMKSFILDVPPKKVTKSVP